MERGLMPLRLAVAGLGEFGLRYVRSLPAQPGVSVAYGVDPDPERRGRAEREFPGLRAVAEIDTICGDATVDAVVVATPEAAHRTVAVAALAAGKHVIVEKPLATTEDDAQAMIDAARKADRLLMTAFLLRFDLRYARLKERLPQIGTVRNLYAYRNFDRGLFHLYSRTHSFIENAIHDIDLMLWLVGRPVARAHGFCRNTLGLPNPDVNWGVLEFDGGALGVPDLLALSAAAARRPAMERRDAGHGRPRCPGGRLRPRRLPGQPRRGRHPAAGSDRLG